MDKADLDFGIYRIMNQKRSEINDFLKNDLLSKVRQEFDNSVSKEYESLELELSIAIEQAKKFGAPNPENVEPVLEIKKRIKEIKNNNQIEDEIFSNLYTFFSRYYDKGDFISQRRYKDDSFIIPHQGEEIKMYWVNFDQYYIKSSNYLRDYKFVIKDPKNKTFHFKIKLIDADIEKNNLKAKPNEERKFIINEKNPITLETNEFCINLNFDVNNTKQDVLNENTIKTIFENENKHNKNWINILKMLSPTKKNQNRTVLEKHLDEYTSKNTFDYFIHKNLDHFLTRELNWFIKNEILDIHDINPNTFKVLFNKIKIFYDIAKKIIAMLAQIENFQKKLWIKKKFIISTNYIITIDKINSKFFKEICSNKNQISEWISLGFIPNNTKINEKYLKNNLSLIVDTKYFSNNFKYNILAEIENIDEELTGLLINSENFQALNLISSTFENKCDFIYIDPPYNTSEIGFIYKNKYRHSSWSSMIQDRIKLSKKLLTDSGIIGCAIDDLEFSTLQQIMDNIFDQSNRLGNLIIVNKPSGRTIDKYLATSHEYMLFYGNSSNVNIDFFELTDEESAKYTFGDNEEKYKWRDFLRTGGNSTPELSPRQYYPIYYNPKTKKCKLEKFDGSVGIFPIDSKGVKRVWRKTKKSFLEHLEKNEINFKQNKDGQWKVQLIDRIKPGTRPKSVWRESKYDSSAHGTKLLKNMFGESSFSFPKSIHAVYDVLYINTLSKEQSWIVDYFAGSGTTGHAVLKLNKDEGGKRKFMLVEHGDYFDSILVPRIKKASFSINWKDGKPISNDSSSVFIKSIKLESYEDTLNNLRDVGVKTLKHSQLKLLKSHEKLFEEYNLYYWLDVETENSDSLLNINKFKNPFNYELAIGTSSVGSTKLTKIDLIETFNYLLGLTVKTINMINKCIIIKGTNTKNERVLTIWRDVNKNDNHNLENLLKEQKYDNFDYIYINGDCILDDPLSKIKMIEIEFKRLMFNTSDV